MTPRYHHDGPAALGGRSLLSEPAHHLDLLRFAPPRNSYLGPIIRLNYLSESVRLRLIQKSPEGPQKICNTERSLSHISLAILL